LWVAQKKDKSRVLDEILADELDEMTGLADELYFSGQWEAALLEYRKLARIIRRDDTPKSLKSYPAISAYLNLRSGQCHAWLTTEAYEEAVLNGTRAQRHDDEAEDVAQSPGTRHLVPNRRKAAQSARDTADVARRRGQSHLANAQKYLEQAARDYVSASGGTRMYQAHNELGLLAFRRAGEHLQRNNLQEAEQVFTEALRHFEKAVASGRGQDYLKDNLVATHNALADIAYTQGSLDDAMRQVQQAMALSQAQEPSAGAAYVANFHAYLPARGEQIAFTAPLEAGLARKYISIDTEKPQWSTVRKRIAATPGDAVWKLWTDTGGNLLKNKTWYWAAGFYEGLHTTYLQDSPKSVPASFRKHVNASLVTAFGELGQQLYEQKRFDEAVLVYKRALRYVPSSRVLTSGFFSANLGIADAALERAHWDSALSHLDPLRQVYGCATEVDEKHQSTCTQLDTRYAAAHLGIASDSLAGGRLEAAARHADSALAVNPERREYRKAKADVLFGMGRQLEGIGDWETALAYYEDAMELAPWPRYGFAAGTLKARLIGPRLARKSSSFLNRFGFPAALALVVLITTIIVGRLSWSNHSRRTRARALRREASRAYKDRNWHDAIQALTEYRAVIRGGLDAEILELMARSYRRIGDYGNALRYFDMAASRDASRRYHIERCEIYIIRRNIPLAVHALAASKDLESDAERMIHFVNFLRERHGDSAFFTEAIGALQLLKSDLESARMLYVRLQEQDAENLRYLRQLADISKLEGNTRRQR
jgi:tetratricopeptide (TPR) repeat protein